MLIMHSLTLDPHKTPSVIRSLPPRPRPCALATQPGPRTPLTRTTFWRRYVLKAADDIEVGWKTGTCEYRVDLCACLQEPVPLSNVMRGFAYAQMLVAVLELSGFYLKVPIIAESACEAPSQRLLLR